MGKVVVGREVCVEWEGEWKGWGGEGRVEGYGEGFVVMGEWRGAKGEWRGVMGEWRGAKVEW